VLLNWYCGCLKCRAAFHLERQHIEKRYGDDVSIVAVVSLDHEKLANFRGEHDDNWHWLFSKDRRLKAQYRADPCPRAWLIDEKGVIQQMSGDGAEPTKLTEQMSYATASLLARSGKRLPTGPDIIAVDPGDAIRGAYAQMEAAYRDRNVAKMLSFLTDDWRQTPRKGYVTAPVRTRRDLAQEMKRANDEDSRMVINQLYYVKGAVRVNVKRYRRLTTVEVVKGKPETARYVYDEILNDTWVNPTKTRWKLQHSELSYHDVTRNEAPVIDRAQGIAPDDPRVTPQLPGT
jgi:hypothetical protein